MKRLFCCLGLLVLAGCTKVNVYVSDPTVSPKVVVDTGKRAPSTRIKKNREVCEQESSKKEAPCDEGFGMQKKPSRSVRAAPLMPEASQECEEPCETAKMPKGKKKLVCMESYCLRDCACPLEKNWLLQGKAAYFWPFGERFHDIYGGTGIYGVEFTAALHKSMSGNLYNTLYLWVDANYLETSGTTLGVPGYSTTLTMVPLSLGLQYMPHFQVRCKSSCPVVLRPYIGIGVEATYLHIRNHTPLPPEHFENWGGGGVGKLGFIIDLPQYWFLNIFSTYSYMKIHDNNVSGGTLGGGLGYSW